VRSSKKRRERIGLSVAAAMSRAAMAPITRSRVATL
jgi:hypothetical protein